MGKYIGIMKADKYIYGENVLTPIKQKTNLKDASHLTKMYKTISNELPENRNVFLSNFNIFVIFIMSKYCFPKTYVSIFMLQDVLPYI